MAERKSYAELLRDPSWQRRRLDILDRNYRLNVAGMDNF